MVAPRHAPGESTQPGKNTVGLSLTPVPGQQLVGPTAQDSAVFSLGGQSLSTFSFNFFEFEYVIFERDIFIPLFNEVRLIPFEGDLRNQLPTGHEVEVTYQSNGGSNRVLALSYK